MAITDKNEKWSGDIASTLTPQAKNDGSTTMPFMTISEDNQTGGSLGVVTIKTADLMANDLGGSAKNFYAVVYDSTKDAKVMTSDGVTITYDANGKYDYLKAGQPGIDTFDYTIQLANGVKSTATVTLKIIGVNDAAVIGSPIDAGVTEDESSPALTATGTISITDKDAGEASFKTNVVSGAGNLGTLSLSTNGAYTYTVDNNKVQYLGAGQEKVETFTVEALDGTTKQVNFTITGTYDAPPTSVGVTFGRNNFEGGEVSLDIERSGDLSQPLDVNFALSGTAQEGQDYQAVPHVAHFNAGSNLARIVFQTFNDTVIEGADDIRITLAPDPSYQFSIYGPTGHTIIYGDDFPDITVSDATANEADSTITFKVRLSDQLQTTLWNQSLEMDYATADSSAKAGEDYTATSGHLLFLPGQTEQIVTVPIINDAVFEGDENFYRDLFNAVGNAGANIGVPILDPHGVGTLQSDWTTLQLSDIVGVSIPEGSNDADSYPVRDNIWTVSGSPAPSNIGIGWLINPGSFAYGNYAMHDHVYVAPYVPNPTRTVVTFEFAAPTNVDEITVVEHGNGVTKLHGYVGDSLDAMTSVGSLYGSLGDRDGWSQFVEGQENVFDFDNSMYGKYFQVVIEETSLYDGYALYRMFPEGTILT
jgi:VCBS repeat-containing protein